MNLNGIIVGAATFLIIGLCHPLVIKAEYHIGKKSWWGFLFIGASLAILSMTAASSVRLSFSTRRIR